jgi:hypothetical protein
MKSPLLLTNTTSRPLGEIDAAPISGSSTLISARATSQKYMQAWSGPLALFLYSSEEFRVVDTRRISPK